MFQQQASLSSSRSRYAPLGAFGALSASDVRTAQAQLNSLSSNLAKLTVDGILGPKTVARIKEFQAAYALPVTGQLDTITLQVLSRETASVTRPRIVTTSPVPGAVTGAGQVISTSPGAEVQIGDTVLVQINTVCCQGFLQSATAARPLLTNRLEVAGFRVVQIDDSAISSSPLSRRGDLLVTVQALSSSYGRVADVGSIVRGAAEAVGYGGVVGGGPDLVSARVIARGTGAGAGQQPIYNAPGVPPSSFDLSSILPWAIGGVAVVVILSVLKNR